MTCRLYPDVEPALARLTAYRMGTISNGERSQQYGKLVRTGIAHHFEALAMAQEAWHLLASGKNLASGALP